MSGPATLLLPLAVLALRGGDPPPPAPGDQPVVEPAWTHALAWLREEEERMEADLEAAHAVLRQRAAEEDPALLARIDPEPPRARPTGYGLLPPVEADRPPRRAGEPRRRTYSLAALPGLFATDLLDAALLAERAPVEPMPAAVEELERLRGRLKKLDEHLTYHAWWQRAIVDDADFFAERNEVLALVRAWRAAVAAGGGSELAGEVRERVSPFRPTPGLRIERDGRGVATLAVEVVTDVEDEEFLGHFRRAVHEHWNQSAALRDERLAIALHLVVRPVAELYPEGAPAIGATLDTDDHLARFPEGAIVLTTGAKSTHARQGRYLQLGSQPITPRTLAHEFGHLLGFSDAYLRAYEGDPGGKYGAVLVEWHGLVDDLMGDTRNGTVGAAMVAELLHHYGE